jgi:hypothetical protein
LSSETGSFICQSLPNVGDLNGSNAEFDDDDGRASGQVVCDNKDNGVDGLSCNDEPCLTEVVFDNEDFDAEPRSGSKKEHNPNNTREEVETTAQLATTKSLSFKNFMDYCHKFASAIWKKLVEDRELYAGLIIGLTEEGNRDDESVSPCEDLQAVLLWSIVENFRIESSILCNNKRCLLGLLQHTLLLFFFFPSFS